MAAALAISRAIADLSDAAGQADVEQEALILSALESLLDVLDAGDA